VIEHQIAPVIVIVAQLPAVLVEGVIAGRQVVDAVQLPGNVLVEAVIKITGVELSVLGQIAVEINSTGIVGHDAALAPAKIQRHTVLV
jgi:hypothetical protein